MREDFFWLGFSAFRGIGPAKFRKLLLHFGSAKQAWLASEKDLLSVLGSAVTTQFLIFRAGISLAAYVKNLEDKKISFLLSKDTNYPQLLAKIPNPPFVLYVKGDKEIISSLNTGIRSIGVVGTRKVTRYGEEVTTFLTKELIAQGFVIVSGLALGVDAIAHQATIESGGKTIAVLGCGVDCCSPSINQPIYDKIIGNFGAVVAESAYGGVVAKGMFPARNRIIAGLSLGVVVTEGTQDSGALITATRALEYHRPVCAVPGPITSVYSKGPLHLIQQGATIVREVDDILQALDIKKSQHIRSDQINQKRSNIQEEQQLLELLAQEQLYFDEIVRRLRKDPKTVSSLLSMMEIKGFIKSSGGKFHI